jgi:RND family efflux transporter MFP subunit
MSSTSTEPDRTTDALAKLRIERGPRRADAARGGRGLKILLVLGVAVALGGTCLALARKNGWLGAGGSWFAVPEIIQTRPEARLAKVSVQTGRAGDAIVVATGYLESRRQARIGARAPGRLEVVHVEEGTRVRAGQVLAVLEHADLDASIAAVEASLSRAKAALQEQEIAIRQSQKELDRIDRLKKTRSVAETEYDAALFKLESAVARRASLVAEIALAEARLREAQQQQANMFIRAPFDGTVISKDAEVGESILPGGMGEASGRGSAVTVADLDHLEVECDVKEDYIGRVIPGAAAEVAVDAVPGFRYQGRVRKIIPMGDRARATIKVQVEIVNTDERLFPNMSATVYFLPVETPETPQIAESRIFCDSAALRSDDKGSYVWTVDDKDRAQRLDVVAGPERDGRVEIKSGLSGSERVIITTAEIKPGQLLKVIR